MRRFFVCLMAFIVAAVALVSCGKGSESSGDAGTEKNNSPEALVSTITNTFNTMNTSEFAGCLIPQAIFDALKTKDPDQYAQVMSSFENIVQTANEGMKNQYGENAAMSVLVKNKTDLASSDLSGYQTEINSMCKTAGLDKTYNISKGCQVEYDTIIHTGTGDVTQTDKSYVLYIDGEGWFFINY